MTVKASKARERIVSAIDESLDDLTTEEWWELLSELQHAIAMRQEALDELESEEG